jgi:transcription factor S
MAVIEKDKDLSTEPTISIECPRCGNNKAYVWQVQTRGVDEILYTFHAMHSLTAVTFREYT